jgi:hypothetical protein
MIFVWRCIGLRGNRNRKQAVSTKDKLLHRVTAADLWLKKAMGEGNEILYHFVRLLAIAVVFALLVALVIWVVSLLYHAVAAVVSALIIAAPYLLAIAIVAGVVALSVYAYRKRRQRRALEAKPETIEQPEASGRTETPPSRPQRPADARPASDDEKIRHALAGADEATRDSLKGVLASLQRFDHRLELVITPAHYTDLFGDNWAHVRQFVESPQGKSVAAVSVMLVELMILYKRAQEVRWVPINDERIRAWWHEAARRRKWLADLLDSGTLAESVYDVQRPPSDDADSAQAEAALSAAPQFNSPPSLDDMLRYYQWISRESPGGG